MDHDDFGQLYRAICPDGEQTGRSSLFGSRPPANDSLWELTINVRVLSLQELLGQLGWSRVDLLKIDVEGAEIGLLAACPDEVLGRVAQISIEFHDFCGITAPADVSSTLARLNGLGFYSVRMSRVGHQDTWLVNRHLVNISYRALPVLECIDMLGEVAAVQ